MIAFGHTTLFTFLVLQCTALPLFFHTIQSNIAMNFLTHHLLSWFWLLFMTFPNVFTFLLPLSSIFRITYLHQHD